MHLFAGVGKLFNRMRPVENEREIQIKIKALEDRESSFREAEARLEERERFFCEREELLLSRERDLLGRIEAIKHNEDDLRQREARLEEIGQSIVNARDTRRELEKLKGLTADAHAQIIKRRDQVLNLQSSITDLKKEIEVLRNQCMRYEAELKVASAKVSEIPSPRKWVDIDDIVTHSCWTDDMRESTVRILNALKASGKFGSISRAMYDSRSGNMHFVARLASDGNIPAPTLVIGANWRTKKTWSSVSQHGQEF